MVRASRSQLEASSGATATSWPNTNMPERKSFFWKAASASCFSAAGGLVTGPASLLICASSLMAASSSARCLRGLSAAIADDKTKARNAAARPARTKRSMDQILPEAADRRVISSPDGVERMAAGGELAASMPRHFLNWYDLQKGRLIS